MSSAVAEVGKTGGNIFRVSRATQPSSNVIGSAVENILDTVTVGSMNEGVKTAAFKHGVLFGGLALASGVLAAGTLAAGAIVAAAPLAIGVGLAAGVASEIIGRSDWNYAFASREPVYSLAA